MINGLFYRHNRIYCDCFRNKSKVFMSINNKDEEKKRKKYFSVVFILVIISGLLGMMY